MKVDGVCGDGSLISFFCFILGDKDHQKPSDRSMGGPRAGLDNVIKRNITGAVMAQIIVLPY
jgi:hypothetical protein